MANPMYGLNKKDDAIDLVSAGKKLDVVTVTSSITLSEADSGKVYLIGTDALTITLPATVKGVYYTFINIGADGNNIITISPQSADAIWGTITLAGSVVDLSGTDDKDLINTKGTAIKGDSVTLVSDGTDWFVTASTGIWAAES